MFASLLNRSLDTTWQKIPWHDADFSRRMLAEHLSQTHDLASRRFTIIDQHITWIHTVVLRQKPSRILDLGCGPGFYTSRLTALGHTCTGVDFSPAAITYARQHDTGTQYIRSNILDVAYQQQFDLVMLIYGELNAFSPDEARRIVAGAHAALKPGGMLLLELHPAAYVKQIGNMPPTWYTAEKGLFSDQPYLCLAEPHFIRNCALTNFFVFDAASGAMQQYTTMLQAYTDDAYRDLLSAFTKVTFYPTLTGASGSSELFALLAEV